MHIMHADIFSRLAHVQDCVFLHLTRENSPSQFNFLLLFQ